MEKRVREGEVREFGEPFPSERGAGYIGTQISAEEIPEDF